MKRWIVIAALAAGPGCGLGRTAMFVDSIEGGRAVLVGEDGAVVTRDVRDLPPGAQEGDVYVEGRRDEDARRRLVEEIRARRARLVRGGGDFSLEAP